MPVQGKRVAVVMPAYNAEKTLHKAFDEIPKEWVDDIILVDDGSKDRTVETARLLPGVHVVVHERNTGYGSNQKTCYREALERGADHVVMVHPDHQYDPKVIPELVTPLLDGRCDAVFGSRMLGGRAREGGMPWWKYVANIGLTRLENAVLGLHLTEYHSGFRAYSRRYLERVPFELNSDSFVFDTEIIVQAVTAGLRIHEIPIATRYFPEASQIGLLASTRYGLSILQVLWRFVLHRAGLRRRRQFEPTGSGRAAPPVTGG